MSFFNNKVDITKNAIKKNEDDLPKPNMDLSKFCEGGEEEIKLPEPDNLPKEEEQVFEKPKKEVKPEPVKKKKKQISERQRLHLAKMREKSLAKRKQIREEKLRKQGYVKAEKQIEKKEPKIEIKKSSPKSIPPPNNQRPTMASWQDPEVQKKVMGNFFTHMEGFLTMVDKYDEIREKRKYTRKAHNKKVVSDTHTQKKKSIVKPQSNSMAKPISKRNTNNKRSNFKFEYTTDDLVYKNPFGF